MHEEAKIFETLEYGLFETFFYNRKRNEALVRVLMESINAHGFLLPILVQVVKNAKDEKYFIIDGQHRYWAAQELGVAMKYIVITVPNNGVPVLVSSINSIGKKWSLQNYFDMYVLLEKPEYLKVQGFLQTNSLTLVESVILLKIRSQYESYKRGELILKETAYSIARDWLEKMNAIMAASTLFEEYKNDAAFRMAIISIIMDEAYDHNRMLGKLVDKAGMIVKSRSIRDYVGLFENVFNYGRPRKNGTIFSRAT